MLLEAGGEPFNSLISFLNSQNRIIGVRCMVKENDVAMFTKIKKILKFKKNLMIFVVCALFFPGAFLALILGATFDMGKFLLGLLIVLAGVYSSQYSNEYFDQEVDTPDSTTSFSGGTGILITNPELAESFRLIALSLMALSILLGIIFTLIYNATPLLLLLVMAGNLISWYYTAPPVRMAYYGWGGVAMAVSFGFLVPALGFLVVMSSFNIIFLIFVIPLILYRFAGSVNKDIPDMETDKVGSKNTMIVRWGRKFGFKLVAVLSFLATLSYIVMYFTEIFPNTINFGLITLFSLIPLSLAVLGYLKRTDEREKSIMYVNYNFVANLSVMILISLYFLYILVVPCF